jgi:hypothetical protein
MKTLFQAEQFTPTEFSSAGDKARFANHFVRWVQSDFKKTLFPKWFYKRLSMCFGHIAHYNQPTFYHHFTSTTAAKLEFLRQTVCSSHSGSPQYTYCDVERVLAAWVVESGLIDKYRTRAAMETETSERALLAQLKAKYEVQR